MALWNPSRAPALPVPTAEISPTYIGKLLNVLRLYFNQVDTANLGARAAIATLQLSVTDEYLYIPTIAGVPVDPPADYTGHVAFVYDTTGDDLYVYNGSWKKTTTFT